MIDKAKLGTRYVCFKCGTKFYDLLRPVPNCPECKADQREAPARDIRALLGSKGAVRKYADEDEGAAEEVAEAGEDDEDAGLLGGVDDEDEDEVDVGEDDEAGDEEAAGGGDEDE